MTSPDSHDADVESLERLTILTPDPERAARVRARCRGQLERCRRRSAHTAAVTEFASRVFVPVVLGAFCVFYVVVLVATTLRLQGVVH